VTPALSQVHIGSANIPLCTSSELPLTLQY